LAIREEIILTPQLNLNLGSYSYEIRHKIFTSLSGLLEKVQGDKDGNKINRIEKDYTRETVLIWNKRATTAVRNGVNSFAKTEAIFTKSDEAKVFKAVEKAYNSIEKEVGPKILKATESIFNISQERFIKRNNLKIEKQDGDGIDFFEFESSAIAAQMARIQTISIGDHFDKTLKPIVASSIEKAVFEKGLNKKQAGEFLKSELVRKLGGKAFLDSVPPGIRKQGLNSKLFDSGASR
jgi:hypothetical protein